MPETVSPYANQVVQIQIQPVDNGFVMQVANIDGKGKGLRRIALDTEAIRKELVDVAALLFSEPDKPSGLGGPQSSVGA
jgi:hypothetical protein